jgi:hypothetical protein
MRHNVPAQRAIRGQRGRDRQTNRSSTDVGLCRRFRAASSADAIGRIVCRSGTVFAATGTMANSL